MKVAFGSEGRVRGLKASESGFGVRGESEGDSRPVKVAFGSEGREVIDEGIDWDHISGGVLLSNPRPPRISLDMPTLSSRINPIDPPSLPPSTQRAPLRHQGAVLQRFLGGGQARDPQPLLQHVRLSRGVRDDLVDLDPTPRSSAS